MKKTIITCFVCCLLGLVKGWAHPYKVSEIPMVHLQDRTRYVSNPDQILSASSVSSIDNILYALEQRTGIETLVVAVKEIEGGDCFEFALQLGKQNGVGKKQTDNGLVILLVTEERCIQFVTGYGLEGILPDAICKRIQNRFMNTPFSQGDWDNGMLAGIQAIDSYLKDYQDGTEQRAETDSMADLYPLLFAALVILLFCFFAYRRMRRKSQCPHCKKHTLYRSDSRLISNVHGIRREEVVYTCSNCGYTVVREEESRDDRHDGFGGGRGGGPIIFGGGLVGGRGGGGFSGGSFGGGNFGGGGAGSKF